MKFLTIRNKTKQNKFNINEIQYSILKSIYFSEKFPLTLRLKVGLFLSKNKVFLVNIKRSCFFTKRNRGFIRFFALSRILVRDKARFNHLPFVQKISW